MRAVVVGMFAVLVVAGCTSSDQAADTTATSIAASSTPETVPPSGVSVPGNVFGVKAYGLEFRLPDSFVAGDDPEYLFSARSTSPTALFTIAEDVPRTTDYVARPGEVLSDRDLGGLDVVVVTGAALDGLPEGLSANEFLVSNGQRSFSVIMSAPSADLPGLWEVFVDSVTVETASAVRFAVANECGVPVEVALDLSATNEVTQGLAWVEIAAGASAEVEPATAALPEALYLRSPDAEDGMWYELAVIPTVEVVGGESGTMLLLGPDQFCP